MVPEESVRRALSFMRQPAFDVRLTPQLARDVCERTASAAVVEGSIDPLGSKFVLGLNAKNCQTGEVTLRGPGAGRKKRGGSECARADYFAVEGACWRIACHVTEGATPLLEATTSSTEALKAFTAGAKRNGKGQSYRSAFFRAGGRA